MKGEVASPEILNRSDFDLMPWGEDPQFVVEGVKSQRYKDLMDKLLQKYDRVVVVSRASALSAEAEALGALFDACAITIGDESLEAISSYSAELMPERKISLILV